MGIIWVLFAIIANNVAAQTTSSKLTTGQGADITSSHDESTTQSGIEITEAHTSATTEVVKNVVSLTHSIPIPISTTKSQTLSHQIGAAPTTTAVLETSTAEGKTIAVDNNALLKLCHNMCNCQFRRISISIVCSQRTNVAKKTDVTTVKDGGIDSGSKIANTGYNENSNKPEIGSVKHVYIEGYEDNIDTLVTALSFLPNLSKLSIKNSSIAMMDSTKREFQFPSVRNLTLEHVSLHRNASLPSGLFWSFFLNTHSLVLNNCDAENLEKFNFGIFENLKSIDISHNIVRFLNASHFPKSDGLVHLNASHSKIYGGTLGCDTKRLTNLAVLDLAYNEIAEVESMMCQSGIKSLTYLDLSHNLISHIAHGAFDEFKNLVQLDLSHNLIDTIGFGTFGCGLSALLWLSLKDNELLNVDTYAFYPLQDLREIYLSNNMISHVSDSIGMNTSNSASCMPTYNILDEDLEPYPPVKVSVWPHLETVDISYNNLTNIEARIFEGFFKHSRHLSLSNNRISSLPHYGIEHLHRLEDIDISYNEIDWMDVGTFTNPHLKNIDLSHNKLKKIISMTFLYLPNLQHLNLSHNKLNYIYRLAFYKTCKYGQKMTLDLNHNRLTEETIWKFMTSFVEIKNENCQADLILDKNRVKYFLDAPSKKSILRAIRSFDDDSFTKWGRVDVSLQDNQLHCDCQLYKDIKLIKQLGEIMFKYTNETEDSNSIGFIKPEGLYCTKPVHYKEKTLLEIEADLERNCVKNIPNKIEKQKGCVYPKRTSVSLQDTHGINCVKETNNKNTNYIPATLISFGVSFCALIAVAYGLKRTGVISKLRSKYKWYRVYTDDSSCSYGHTITAHYNREDKTLIQSELLYFLQECCPAYNISMKESHKIADTICDMSHQSCRLNINLFVISLPLMREIKANVELQSYYQSLIEQETVAIFLFMDEKQEMESIHPTFWAKIKHRQNVYSVSGEEKLQKLQSVLSSTTASNFFEHEHETA